LLSVFGAPFSRNLTLHTKPTGKSGFRKQSYESHTHWTLDLKEWERLELKMFAYRSA